MNLYTLLEVQRSSTEEEIKASYRKLAMRYHPDRTQGDKAAEEKFKQIKQAYETLSDPERRRIYDDTGDYSEVSPDDVEAMQVLLQVFNACLKDNLQPLHVLLIARSQLSDAVNQVVMARNNTYTERNRVLSMRGKIKSKEGKRNLVDMLIGQRLRDLDLNVHQMNRRESVLVLAMRMLDDHGVDELVQLFSP